MSNENNPTTNNPKSKFNVLDTVYVKKSFNYTTPESFEIGVVQYKKAGTFHGVGNLGESIFLYRETPEYFGYREDEISSKSEFEALRKEWLENELKKLKGDNV